MKQQKNFLEKSHINENIKMKPLNLKGIMNENKNSDAYKSLTTRGEQAKQQIIISMRDELSKNGNCKNKMHEKYPIQIIKEVYQNKNIIKNDAVFEIVPLKIKDILFLHLPRYNIEINQKNSKDNYFVFHCSKGFLKILIELLKLKENNFIFVKMRLISGSQKDFMLIRKQILDIIHNYKNKYI